MGMLVNDVTALVASLAKVCQPRLRGCWGLGQLGGSRPATGTAADHTTSATVPPSQALLSSSGEIICSFVASLIQ